MRETSLATHSIDHPVDFTHLLATEVANDVAMEPATEPAIEDTSESATEIERDILMALVLRSCFPITSTHRVWLDSVEEKRVSNVNLNPNNTL